MIFQKNEILDKDIYYGFINKIPTIVHISMQIHNELDVSGKLIIKNENFHKVRLKNDIIINYYYPATQEMIDNYKNKIKIITESYQEYIEKVEPFINSVIETNTKWINNILYNNYELDRVIFKNNKFIITKNIGYDSNNEFYLLAIPFEKIKTVRDLNIKHKKLLKEMKNKSLEIAFKNNLLEEDLYLFFHYHPSCYHLHLHICLNNHKSLKCKLYRHLLFETVLKDLEIIRKKELKFEINISNPIYKLLKNITV
jgi:m7GpppX diphosphatase